MFWGNSLCQPVLHSHNKTLALTVKGISIPLRWSVPPWFCKFWKLASSQPHTRWTTVWRFWQLWLEIIITIIIIIIIEINVCRTGWICHYFYIIVNIANTWWEKLLLCIPPPWPCPNTLTKIVLTTLNRQLSLTLRLISGICEEVMDPSALWFYILSESSRLTQFFSYMNIALL